MVEDVSRELVFEDSCCELAAHAVNKMQNTRNDFACHLFISCVGTPTDRSQSILNPFTKGIPLLFTKYYPIPFDEMIRWHRADRLKG